MRAATARRALLLVVRAVVTASIVLAVATVGGLALLRQRGQQVMVVTSGSMVPTYEAGDVVLVRPDVDPEALRPGMVVTFHAPGEPEHLTTHRIVTLRPRAEGLFVQTRGDANAAPDPSFTPVGSIVAVAGARVPHAGHWLYFFESRTGRLLVLGTPLVAIALAELADLLGLGRGRRPRRSDPAPPARPVGVGLATVATVVASVALGVGLTALTGATFTTQATLAANRFATKASFCASTTGYTTAVGADAPNRWFRLGEAPGATTAANAGSLGSGAAATYRNGVVLGQGGALRCDASTAASFDGVDDRVTGNELLGSLAPQVFSVELWFRTTVGGGRLLGFGSSQTGTSLVSDRHLYLTDGGALVFGTQPLAMVAVTTPGTYLDGAWHHVVTTVDGSGSRLYVDGPLRASSTTGGAALLSLGWWRIGGDTTAGWPGASTRTHYTGLIDEVAVYPTALSAARVAAHQTAGTMG